MFADAATARLDVKKIERPNRELHPRKCGECGVCSTLGSASKGDGNGFSGTTDKNMKAIITTLVAASVSMTSLAGFATEAAAKRKYVYAYAPYAYGPYVASPPWFAYSTYSSGFSPYPHSDGYGAYARSSSGFVPSGYGFYAYRPDPDSASGYGPFFGSNPWWRVMSRFGMDGKQ